MLQLKGFETSFSAADQFYYFAQEKFPAYILTMCSGGAVLIVQLYSVLHRPCMHAMIISCACVQI